MLSIIVATANNNIIGGNNKLLWHIPEDLKRFKSITSGHTIIMGRKTFESLPGVLPNRKHIVITRDKDFNVDNVDVEIVNNIKEVINRFINTPETAYIIGGGEIYKQLIHNVNNLFLTEVLENFEGDTTFPQINYNDFTVDYQSEILISEKSKLKYRFTNLSKK